jgi:hypothetical protein
MKSGLAGLKLFTLVGLLLPICSCIHNTDSLTPVQRSIVMDSVQQMVDSIAKTISREGPVAWLRYFENSPDFYMASDGQLAFTNYDSISNFLKNSYSKSVRNIELSWNHVRIEPFTSKKAGVAANFHEDITDFDGRKTASDGYFTGIAHQTSQGWQFQNAHWSIMHAN